MVLRSGGSDLGLLAGLVLLEDHEGLLDLHAKRVWRLEEVVELQVVHLLKEHAGDLARELWLGPDDERVKALADLVLLGIRVYRSEGREGQWSVGRRRFHTSGAVRLLYRGRIFGGSEGALGPLETGATANMGHNREASEAFGTAAREAREANVDGRAARQEG